MSQSDQSADPGEQIEELVRSRAGNVCEGERCDTKENLQIYDVANEDGFSIDHLSLLCNDCYSREHSTQKVTVQSVLDRFESINLPFITTSDVAQYFDVSTTLARDRLNTLVDDGDLQRYNLDERRTLYFKPDFRAGNELLEGLRQGIDFSDLDLESVKAFAKQPYKILPKDEGEYWVVVPNFLNFSIGHLHDKDEAWRTYIVNRYVSWFSELPDTIQNEITLRKQYEDAKIDGNTLQLANEEERERAWDNFGGQNGPLVQREEDTKIRVQNGKEFEVIANLIDGGNLPFTPSPMDSDDIRAAPTDVSLREYQEEAWETLEEYGSIGVYWPMGLGKSWFARYAGNRIKGKKLVVVPSTTLKQQWVEDIEANAYKPDEWDVQTYQYLTHSEENLAEYQGDNAPVVTIYDESHYTPANKFSQLSMIDTKYRIGLSASPYREDDRTEYIFALTGYPVGVDWQDLIKYGSLEYPDVHVYTYTTQRQKREDLYELARQKPGRGLVFCDSREKGDRISDELGVPFVNGDTPAEDRMGIISDETNNVVVVSRIADEGMSLPDLDWSIEFDFLGSSRRQELQRTGRLMHGDGSDIEIDEDADRDDNSALVTKNGLHIVQMTDDELEKHGERLYSLEEHGFGIQLERRA